jgi:hypothetical protein
MESVAWNNYFDADFFCFYLLSLISLTLVLFNGHSFVGLHSEISILNRPLKRIYNIIFALTWMLLFFVLSCGYSDKMKMSNKYCVLTYLYCHFKGILSALLTKPHIYITVNIVTELVNQYSLAQENAQWCYDLSGLLLHSIGRHQEWNCCTCL